MNALLHGNETEEKVRAIVEIADLYEPEGVAEQKKRENRNSAQRHDGKAYAYTSNTSRTCVLCEDIASNKSSIAIHSSLPL